MTRWLGIAALGLATACGGSSMGDDTGDDDDTQCADGVLTCTPAVMAACAGDTTNVNVPTPDTCGGPVTISDDRPGGGFPLGETTVTFMGGGDACTTVVTVSDDTAPELTCPPAQTVVRTSPDDPVTVPEATATDACSDVTVTTSPSELQPGVNTVTYTATDAAGLTAECQAELTVIDLFAPERLRVISATLQGDGTTSVVLAWEPVASDGVTGYRVERAAAADGPWSELGVAGAGELTYLDPAMPGTAAYYRVVTLADTVDGGASEPARALAIAATGYDVRDHTVPTVGFPTTLYGVVRHPVDLDAGPFPLIVMIHGNHGICRATPDSTNDSCATSSDHECPEAGMVTTPNAEGMAYQAETLAANGYIAVTISANALNCRNDYIPERAQLVIEHLRQWKAWNESDTGPLGAAFVGRVDLSRVGLVGHSRGGDAVSNVPSALVDTPVAGVTVASVFAIAPTDFHDATVVNTPYAVLLPACDGDVSNLIGMDIYDRSVSTADPQPRAQVFYVGANHNFFNTEWYYDDGAGFICDAGDGVGKQAQQGMLEATLVAWFGGTLGSAPLEPWLRADGTGEPAGVEAWAGADLDLRWSYSSPARTVIDAFEGAGSPDANELGGANTFADFTEWRRCFENDCDSRFDHQKWAAYLRWDTATAAVATWSLDGADASAHAALSLRVVSRRSSWNTGRTEQQFWLRVVDGDGTVAELLVQDVQPIAHLYPTNYEREILQTVRVPLADLVAVEPDLDLGNLAAFELDFGYDGERGSVLVTDVELAD